MEEEMNHFGLNMEAGICIFHVTIKRKSLAKKKKKGKDHGRRDIQTFSCTIKEHTIADCASKNGCVEECQYISRTVLFETQTHCGVIVKNCE